MAHALRPLRAAPGSPAELPVSVPENLDDTEALLLLRDEVEARIVRGRLDVVLDCRRLAVLSSPALGWLIDTAAMLSRHGRRLQFVNASPELSFQIRSLGPREGTGGSLPPGIAIAVE